MFLHMSVSHSVQRVGEYLGRYTPSLGRYTPRQVHRPGQYTPLACTPSCQVQPPPPQCMLRYDQQVGGTHPTGMHSCYGKVLLFKYICGNFYFVIYFYNLKVKQQNWR